MAKVQLRKSEIIVPSGTRTRASAGRPAPRRVERRQLAPGFSVDITSGVLSESSVAGRGRPRGRSVSDAAAIVKGAAQPNRLLEIQLAGTQRREQQIRAERLTLARDKTRSDEEKSAALTKHKLNLEFLEKKQQFIEATKIKNLEQKDIAIAATLADADPDTFVGADRTDIIRMKQSAADFTKNVKGADRPSRFEKPLKAILDRQGAARSKAVERRVAEEKVERTETTARMTTIHAAKQKAFDRERETLDLQLTELKDRVKDERDSLKDIIKGGEGGKEEDVATTLDQAKTASRERVAGLLKQRDEILKQRLDVLRRSAIASARFAHQLFNVTGEHELPSAVATDYMKWADNGRLAALAKTIADAKEAYRVALEASRAAPDDDLALSAVVIALGRWRGAERQAAELRPRVKAEAQRMADEDGWVVDQGE